MQKYDNSANITFSICCKTFANLHLQQDYMFMEHTKQQLYHYFYNFASTNI